MPDPHATGSRVATLTFSGSGAYRGVHIGNAHGKIAVWLDKDQALDLATMYRYPDRAWEELHAAVDAAYPEDIDDA